MSISKSLLRAARIQEQIEQLRGQLADLLDQARAEISAGATEETLAKPRRGGRKVLKTTRQSRGAAPRPAKASKPAAQPKAATPARRGRRSPLAGQKRSTSPTGPLAPAVVKVLQSKKQPMNVRDIFEGLTAAGYKFNSAEPKKNLAARIYRLEGVRQVSAGLFGLA